MGKVRALLDIIYPRNDLTENRPLEFRNKGRYLDERSIRFFRFIKDPVCETCGYPIEGEAESKTDCNKCSLLEPRFERNLSVIQLNRAGRNLIHEFKYRNGRYLIHDIRWIVEMSAARLTEYSRSTYVPVPIHYRKMEKRGYNQSKLLAEVFAEVVSRDGSKVVELLRKSKTTSSQTGLDRQQRIANVRRSFEVDPLLANSVWKSSRLIIVDDVFTTGATVNECASVLRKAGFRDISVLTLGHG